jgi:hypothetical protein
MSLKSAVVQSYPQSELCFLNLCALLYIFRLSSRVAFYDTVFCKQMTTTRISYPVPSLSKDIPVSSAQITSGYIYSNKIGGHGSSSHAI